MPEQLTRRQMIKALGLAGAGVSLAAVSGGNPVDAASEALADTKAQPVPRRYWWVKNVDKITMEVDWKNYKRFSEWKTTRGSIKEYRGDAEHAKYMQLEKDNVLKWELENVPGYTTKDVALKNAVGYGRPPFQFMGPQTASTPQERGVPVYKGTPEENSRIITVALRHMGAATVPIRCTKYG